jgi:hypothetical protein
MKFDERAPFIYGLDKILIDSKPNIVRSKNFILRSNLQSEKYIKTLHRIAIRGRVDLNK